MLILPLATVTWVQLVSISVAVFPRFGRINELQNPRFTQLAELLTSVTQIKLLTRNKHMQTGDSKSWLTRRKSNYRVDVRLSSLPVRLLWQHQREDKGTRNRAVAELSMMVVVRHRMLMWQRSRAESGWGVQVSWEGTRAMGLGRRLGEVGAPARVPRNSMAPVPFVHPTSLRDKTDPHPFHRVPEYSLQPASSTHKVISIETDCLWNKQMTSRLNYVGQKFESETISFSDSNFLVLNHLSSTFIKILLKKNQLP